MRKSNKRSDGSYKPSVSIIILFLLVGIVFAGGGAIALVHTAHIKSEYIKTDAVIIRFEKDSYRNSNGHTKTRTLTYIEYELDGKEYVSSLSEYSSSWDVGDTIEVYCNPDNYYDVESGTVGSVLGIIFSIVGTCVMLVPVFLTARALRKKRAHDELIKNGVQVYATVIDISNNPTVTVNGKNPVVIFLEYVDYSGIQHRFRSANIWENTDYSAVMGMQLPVYYDSNDMNNYYVDTSVLFDTQSLNSNTVYH